MSEEFARTRQYEYQANSNLVLEADRDARRGSNEPTGEVESLWGKTHTIQMGSRVTRDRPPSEDITKNKRPRSETSSLPTIQEKASKKQKKKQGIFSIQRGSTVLTETEDLESINYRPKTRESRLAYEEILVFIKQSIGDQPQDVLRSAADEVLSILKDDNIQDFERQRQIEYILNKIPSERFNLLVNLGKQINDFMSTTNEEENEKNADEGVIDEEMGVAVVFDESEEEEEEGINEVYGSDDDEEEAAGVEADAKNRLIKGGDSDDEYNQIEDDEELGVLNVNQIDAHWLQRELSKYYDDANVSAKLSEDVLSILSIRDERECENKLVILLDYDKFDFIKLLLRNRGKILYCTRIKQAQDEQERNAIEQEMIADLEFDGPAILEALQQQASAESWTQDRIGDFTTKSRREARALHKAAEALRQGHESGIGKDVDDDLVQPVLLIEEEAHGLNTLKPERVFDLDNLAFKEGGHLMSNKRCELPPESWRAPKKGYEEVHVPAVRFVSKEGDRLFEVKKLPEWAQPAFEKMSKLNLIQSRMLDVALNSNENLLLCAPTGAGKTNVAMLCMLQQIGQYFNENGTLDLDAFKIVYIAPMKALVQECVQNFSLRLKNFGINVRELSGDSNLTRQQIQDTQVLVSTPEKWDIITRKTGDRTYTQLVKLLIIDEIHLLHDDRGPVLESIIARTIRQIESTQEMIRIVGLSATLPNFEDVATLLRVKPERGLFFFDNSYRPVPLQQQYIGITEKKALKRFQLMNEICFEKVLAQAGRNQVLIFVHSRAETIKTARALRDMALANDSLNKFVREDSATREILQEEAEETAKNPDLKDLLPHGFAIHHAGLARSDRNLVEDLFSDKHIQILVSTATLAWGVNLPAHTVIIKGTQMYSPEKGKWIELSPLDITQMMGRAGRPQFDTEGECIIITSHSELQYYLSLMNQQLPIESQYIKNLPDHLNAEIVLGTIQTVREAANWLGYTYLYVRMLRNPSLYGISREEINTDPSLEQRRLDLVHSAAQVLDKHNLIRYDRKTGVFQATALGRVASYYYVTHESIAVYNEYLKPTMSDIELFRLFSLSKEFTFIHVREEEKLELAKLAPKVPIPIKESLEESSSAKINLLLQSYISNLKLEGFALMADMQYIRQSAVRIMRALFEIALKRNWAALAERSLTVCKMIERRMWSCQNPLRQFGTLQDTILRKLERKDISWERYYDLKPADLGELVKLPKMGKTLHKLVHQFPRVDLAVHVQPVTRSLLRVELTITPDFEFDSKLHDNALLFWVLVEDVDGENILHQEAFILKQQYAQEEHLLTFTVPLFEPLPPQYFVHVVSDRWLQSETIVPISFRHLILPQKNPPHTELLDLQPLPVSALQNTSFENLYHNFRHFNPIQTQVFTALYETDDNVLICAPTGSGKTICAEFAIFRVLASKSTFKRCVYIAPKQEVVDATFHDWNKKFAQKLGFKVIRFTGEITADLRALERSQIILSTAEQWDVISRRWHQRPHVQEISLFIMDELHLLGGNDGPTLEIVVARMRFISRQVKHNIRLIGLGSSIANARDIGEWLGTSSHTLFNFHPNVRPIPLEIHLHGFDINHFSSRMLAMSKPVYNAVVGHGNGKPSIIFVPSRKQAQLTAIDMMTYAASSNSDPNRFLNCSPEDIVIAASRLKDQTLGQTVRHGIGYLYPCMPINDRHLVEELYRDGVLQILVVPYTMSWDIQLVSYLVVIMGTEFYDGREHRYVDYPMTDILQMIGHANRPLIDICGKCTVLCHTPKKDYLRRFLHEALPIESHLDHFLHDHINAEIVSKTIRTKEDAVDYLTLTFFYRRLTQNPNYYNLIGTTHQHLSHYLSELAENIVTDLESSRCIAIENDMDLKPLNLGMIASYYHVKYTTIELFASSLTEKTKMRGLLEIISMATEYNQLPMRHHEEELLQKLAAHQPLSVPKNAKFSDPHTKAFVLLQSYFSRQSISVDLKGDQDIIVADAVRLLQATMDVISSNGWLKPAIASMELIQMAVQGLWDKDPDITNAALLEIPHFTKEIVKRIESSGHEIENALDIIELDNGVREELLQLTPSQMIDVAKFCNSYPSIDLNFQIDDQQNITTGDMINMTVSLERELPEDENIDFESISVVHAPRFPKQKTEVWWLLVGDPQKNLLMSIKRVPLQHRAKISLEFVAPDQPGEYNLVLYLMCDSYLGCDSEFEFNLQVAQGDGESNDDDESDEN